MINSTCLSLADDEDGERGSRRSASLPEAVAGLVFNRCKTVA
ncbi:hypothetical protein P22_3773 [Propionispora sp. 2/2-37]|nr:hypothetical protein P22_3773 [Propionispora sp. 2/2-37]